MEDLTKYHLNNNILCIDLKSFYASVECALRGLDPYETPLVVADKARGGGSIVLAVTPYLKKRGVPSRLRIFELPKDPDIIYAKPQMQKYIEYSTKVLGVYLDFISEEDLYVYSIDEAFLDVTKYLKLYNCTAEELASRILNKIFEELKITATCGVGPNMLIAKLAMDLEAKNIPSNIAVWNYNNISEKLWQITPLSKMWGIGHRMEANLNRLGLYTIGDIANFDKEILKKKYGVLGTELWYHTHGIDMSEVQHKDLINHNPKSFGSGQVLFKDYNGKEILTIILEMTDEVTKRLRLAKLRAKTISLSIGYSKETEGGFSRQITLETPTANESIIYQNLIHLFDTYYEGYPIRRVGINVTNLDSTNTYQFSMFEDIKQIEKEFRLQSALDDIKSKYGKNSITRAVSETEHATAKKRNKEIGGHHV